MGTSFVQRQVLTRFKFWDSQSEVRTEEGFRMRGESLKERGQLPSTKALPSPG